ncbi:unnamed protein product, partial [Ilex paraguariensis]
MILICPVWDIRSKMQISSLDNTVSSVFTRPTVSNPFQVREIMFKSTYILSELISHTTPHKFGEGRKGCDITRMKNWIGFAKLVQDPQVVTGSHYTTIKFWNLRRDTIFLHYSLSDFAFPLSHTVRNLCEQWLCILRS